MASGMSTPLLTTNRSKAALKGAISIGLFKLLDFQPAGRVREVRLERTA
jgi:hypothetical protein